MSELLNECKYRCDYQSCGAIFDIKDKFIRHKDIHNYLEMTQIYRKLLEKELLNDKNNNAVIVNNNQTNNTSLCQPNEDNLQLINELSKSLMANTVYSIGVPLDNISFCDFPNCGQLYDNEIDLNSHQLIHKYLILDPKKPPTYNFVTKKVNNNNVFVCVYPNCQHEVNDSSYNTIVKHFSEHFGPKPFKCHYYNCFKKFEFQNEWQSHQLTHYYLIFRQQQLFSYRCVWSCCPFKTSLVDLIEKHIEKHFKEDKFKCTQENCGKAFPNNSLLNLHLLSSHQCKSLVDLSYYFDKQLVDNNAVFVCQWNQCLFKTCFNPIAIFKHIECHYKKV